MATPPQTDSGITNVKTIATTKTVEEYVNKGVTDERDAE